MFLIVLIPLTFASIERTATTETICNVNICTKTLYSGVMFAQNGSGDWVNPSEILKITKHSDDLTFHYNGIKGYMNLTFETGVIYNDNYYSMQQVKQLKPEIQFNFPTEKRQTYRKYAINITNITLNKTKIQDITLTYKDHYGFTLEQLKNVGKTYIIKSLMRLGFEDLLNNNFTISINKSEKRIYIGNLSDKFIDNSLYLDPTIILQDADTENWKDSYVRVDNPNTNYGSVDGIYVGNDSSFPSGLLTLTRTYISFNLSSVTDAYSIISANLSLYIRYVQSGVTEKYNYSIYHIYDNWKNSSGQGNILNENQLTWNNQPCGINFDNFTNCNLTSEDNIHEDEGDHTGWLSWNVTNAMKTEFAKDFTNISFAIKETNEATQEQLGFYSKEHSTTSTRPKLEIVYYLDIPFVTLNYPINNSELFYYNKPFDFNFTALSYFNILNASLYTNFSGTWQLNTTNITEVYDGVKYNFTISPLRGGYIWNIEVCDVNNNCSFGSNNFTLQINNSFPLTPDNVTIQPSPADTTDNLTGHCNSSDLDTEDSVTFYYRWYKDDILFFNSSQTLGSGNFSADDIIIFSCLASDSYDNTSWVNSSTLTIGDSTPPEIIDITFSAGTNFYSDVTQNITINCTDASSSISWAKYTLNTSGTLANKSMTNVGGDIYSQAQTYGVGTYTVTKFFCKDSSGNLNTTDSNTKLTVIVRPTVEVLVGGGGAPAIRCEEWELLYLGQCLNATWFNITLNIIFPPTQRVDQFNFYYTGKKETDWKFTVLLNKKIRTVNISENTFFLNATIIENEVFLFGKIERFTSLARLDTATIRYTDITGLVKYSTVTIRSYNVWTALIYAIIIWIITFVGIRVGKRIFKGKKIKFLERFRKKGQIRLIPIFILVLISFISLTSSGNGEELETTIYTASTETICKDSECTTKYSLGRKFYNKNGNWSPIDTTLNYNGSHYVADKNIFSVNIKNNKIKIVGENNSEFEFSVPFMNFDYVDGNMVRYSINNSLIDAEADIMVTPYGVEKLITVHNLNLPTNFDYSTQIKTNNKQKFDVKDLIIWYEDNCVDGICEKYYYPSDWDETDSSLSFTLNKTWFDNAVYPIYIDPTVYYNFNDTYNNKAYLNNNLDGARPSSIPWSGTELTAVEYGEINTSDDIYYDPSGATTENASKFFVFNITEDIATITEINVTHESKIVGAGCVDGEDYIWNTTKEGYEQYGTAYSTTEKNNTKQITSDFSIYINSSGYLHLAGAWETGGTPCLLYTDYVEVIVTYSAADTTPPQVTITVNDTSPKINYNISIQVNSTESGYCWIYDNMSMSNSTPVSCNITQTYIINVSGGNNISFNAYANDSTGNLNDTVSLTILVSNTAPATPTIIYPVDGTVYSLTNISLNVSSSDADSDTITYYYFINNTLNKTSVNNHSFLIPTDGEYNFTAMAYDGTNFSANASTVRFTIDTVKPMSNISINDTSPEINGVINVSLNVSDRLNLSYCWFFNNMSMTNSSLIALEGRTSDNSICNNVSIINVSVFNDVLFRGYVNDTSNNLNYSEIVITIADTIKPMSNISINDTSPEINEWVNISLNVSDNEALSHCWFFNNMSFTNSSLIALSGASDHSRCNNISSINVTQGNDVLFIGYVNDTSNNLNYSEIVITITDTTPPTLTNLKFYALNGSKNVIGIDETAFNFSNLEDIEYMEINFTLTDATSLDDIKLFYTANGTNACTLGNNQSSTCYNFDSGTWIEFINDSSSSTFIDWGATGDYINCNYIGTTTARNYTCRLDEHYNPNVWKHYPLNFSDAKWESEVNQRIKKNTIWRINLTNLNVPLDADFYKIDFRVNASIGLTPTQQILTYICNSSFLTGDPSTSTSCQLVGSKLPSQLRDDGTKAREIFTKNLTIGLGDFGCAMITTDSPAAKYYSMKTYKFMGTDSVRTDISTNNGDSYTTLADGYETELNVNWFYNGTDSNVTQFLIKIQSNDTLGNTGNSSLFSMSWISGELNEPPIVDIIVPEIGTNHSGNIQINWTTAEPNGHDFITNITLSNNTITNIASNLDRTIVNFTFDSTTVSDGIYNLTVRSCETSTTELYCGNDTHEITIDNTLPTVTLLSVFTNTFSQELKYTATDNTAIDTCFYSLLTQSGAVAISNTTIASCANTTFSTGSYGSFILYIYANDTAGNIGYDSGNFTVTDISPGTSGGGGGPTTSPSEFTYTVGYICDKVELFREDHTSFDGSLVYDSYDLDSLRNQIRSEKGFTMIDTVLEDYIKNYILICIENDTRKAPSKKWLVNVTDNVSILTLDLKKYEIENRFWASYIQFPFGYTMILEEIDVIEEKRDVYDYINLVFHLRYSDEFTKRLAIVTDGVRSWFVVIIVILISLSIWRIFRKKDE